ncbi:MAG: 4-hydroxybutyrate CoA-transferase [Bdellovibrionales bacterium CG10_big_fil_rev_8_21_14_0_10_45_34]|nr:MAG: 4-hydroxybutyrate CoA-transferase [Bdellovibrionales bacterium CG10_big_fil_rev_8_21_14_0_10_45_34]
MKLYDNARVFIQGGAATPLRLIDLLCEQLPKHTGIEVVHLHTEGPAKYANPEFRDHIKITNLFVGANLRKKLDYSRIDYLPCFLSEIPRLFRSGKFPIDLALVHVSPPDKNGYCSLGVSVDVVRAASESAKYIIAQINPRMPRVHGDSFIHISKFFEIVEVTEELPDCSPAKASAEEQKIGRNVASLIEDGATLQMGIGAIPNSVLSSLHDRKHLGVHTEMWSDGLLELLKSGVVDNSKKKLHPGKTVSGFVMGSRKLYDFIDDNPSVVQLDIEYVNNPINIARNPKVVAINSAVEVDLTGQVCADSVGRKIISGVGGQMDFMRGAALSTGGKPIIAITSRTRSGSSRIVSTLQPGAGVVTTRSHVHYVVTEYGVADLYGKTLGERAKALIAIAHPEDREQLKRDSTTCLL